jgi:flagellar hook assembly protein FlgD
MTQFQVFSPRFQRNLLLLVAFVLPLFMSACGGGSGGPALSEVKADSATLNLSQGGAITVAYHIGSDTKISAFLQGPDGKRYDLRKGEPRTPGDYSMRLDGVVEFSENGLAQRRILPDGQYKCTIQAQNGTQETREFSITGSPAGEGTPEIEALSATPQVISPNFDARDDVATLNWRTTRPATVTVSISGANDFSRVLKTSKNQPAQQDKVDFNGFDQKGDPLPDGVYTYTVEAADKYGNITRRANTLEVKGGGRPQAVISYANITPTEIIKGNVVTVTVRVKNTGKVPIRSQGPESGFMYTTRDTYASIENGRYEDKAGFWRIGVDFDANSGVGDPVRYPFRWGWSSDRDLQPGEEVEIVGQIKVDRDEKDIRLYVGLIQEKIALVQDRQQITTVKITY